MTSDLNIKQSDLVSHQSMVSQQESPNLKDQTNLKENTKEHLKDHKTETVKEKSKDNTVLCCGLVVGNTKFRLYIVRRMDIEYGNMFNETISR